jgi:predicted NAD/FAD-binding protein
MKIAIIGSGVSGIGAVWALNEYSNHEIHLFEADDYLGGHTHTVQFNVPVSHGSRGSTPTNVDTGFIVQSHNFRDNSRL